MQRAKSRRSPTVKLTGGRTRPKADSKHAIQPAPAKPAVKARSRPAAVEHVEIRPATIFSRRTEARRPAILHVPQETIPHYEPPKWLLEECRVAPARAGDQHEILQLLAGLPAPPSRAEFHAAVDHPDHDAANRLVARLPGGRIIGHVEVLPRQILVGGSAVACGSIDRIALVPECRGTGHGRRLVEAAEERMRKIGVDVGFSRTRIAGSFQGLGWTILGRDTSSAGRPTEILARLLDSPQREGEPITMRQWRHVELPAILRIYRQNAGRFVGPLDRNESYSRWLVSRGAFDSILVALMGQDRYDLHETTARIVGYAIQSGNRVLELLADPEFPGLEREILARVCGEAIENDWQEIVYESNALDPLHEAVSGAAVSGVASSGSNDGSVNGVTGAAGDRMIVAKLFNPLGLLQAVASSIGKRLSTAGVRETVELGLDAPSFRGSIIVADGTASVHPGRIGRSYLKIADDELTRLLLGQCDPAAAAAAGRLSASTQIAIKFASLLFPRVPLWCPMWDDLPA